MSSITSETDKGEIVNIELKDGKTETSTRGLNLSLLSGKVMSQVKVIHGNEVKQTYYKIKTREGKTFYFPSDQEMRTTDVMFKPGSGKKGRRRVNVAMDVKPVQA